MIKKAVFAISLILLLGTAVNVKADSIGEKRSFYIEPSYDSQKRQEIQAVLVKSSPKVYFYIDQNWWNFASQAEVYQSLSDLGQEFENNIYPKLTSSFGPEWNPGIDKDSKITVLFHVMKNEAGGYFSTKDEYSQFQISNSNEREMLYINADYITDDQIKSLLAHEFVHLITFNQKENSHNVVEEVWLNEARAEYALSLMGYNDTYEGSNLQRRVQDFSDNSFDALIDWQEKKPDYALVSLFIHYLVDHYGVEILVDSLQSPEVGIDSINYALSKNGFDKDFSQIFLDWTIAVLINDCNYGSKYCYLNENLRNLYVVPKTNFLPLSGESTLTISETVKSWEPGWYKIIGGKGDLKLEFTSDLVDHFSVPYIIKRKNGGYIVNFLDTKEILIKEFGRDIISLYLIPIVNKPNNRNFYSFSWSVSTATSEQESELIEQLLAKIETLTAEILRIQAKINAILASKGIGPSQNQKQESFCQIKSNLSYGLINNQEVRCLQEFLKSQGSEIYPEAIVSGNFYSLTKQAVIRFQEKYKDEILSPWGLTQGNGYVGPKTREKINKIISER